MKNSSCVALFVLGLLAGLVIGVAFVLSRQVNHIEIGVSDLNNVPILIPRIGDVITWVPMHDLTSGTVTFGKSSEVSVGFVHAPCSQGKSSNPCTIQKPAKGHESDFYVYTCTVGTPSCDFPKVGPAQPPTSPPTGPLDELLALLGFAPAGLAPPLATTSKLATREQSTRELTVACQDQDGTPTVLKDEYNKLISTVGVTGGDLIVFNTETGGQTGSGLTSTYCNPNAKAQPYSGCKVLPQAQDTTVQFTIHGNSCQANQPYSATLNISKSQ